MKRQIGTHLVVESAVTRRSVFVGPLITELVLANIATINPGFYHSPLHIHPYHQMDVILDGCVAHQLEGHPERRLKSGQGILIPPLVRHGLLAEDGFSHVSLKLFLAPRMAQRLGDRPFLFSPSKMLKAQLESAAQRCRQDHPLADEALIAAASLGLIEAADTAPPHEAHEDISSDFRRTILPVLARVAEVPYIGWTVADVAEQCRMSADHFTKVFRKTFGITPQVFIVETRLRNAAVDLITEPPMTIEDIAHRAGYGSRHAFTRAFSEHFKTSPDAYRKSPNSHGHDSFTIIFQQAETE